MVARDDHEPVVGLAREGPERLEIRAVGLHDDVREGAHFLRRAAPVRVALGTRKIRVLPHLEEVARDDEGRPAVDRREISFRNPFSATASGNPRPGSTRRRELPESEVEVADEDVRRLSAAAAGAGARGGHGRGGRRRGIAGAGGGGRSRTAERTEGAKRGFIGASFTGRAESPYCPRG